MSSPTRLLVAGVILTIVGFALGSANVDPASAWVGTVGLTLAVAALLWLALAKAGFGHRS